MLEGACPSPLRSYGGAGSSYNGRFLYAKTVPMFIKQLFTPALYALAVTLASTGTAWAERADRNQPMHIEADALRHDEQRQISIFSGNVVLTKGTIVLRGAELQVRQDAQGYQYGVIKAAAGKRAFFRQKRDTAPGAPQEHVEGEAEQIEYDGRKDDVRLLRRAQLRRYVSGRLNDDITGSLITYNSSTDIFTVDSARAPGQSGTTGKRVRAVLSPKNSRSGQATPTPEPTTKPSASGDAHFSDSHVTDAPILRPSLELQPPSDE